MKKASNILLALSVFVLLNFTSCSTLKRYVFFEADNEVWAQGSIYAIDAKYTYRMDSDSIMIYAATSDGVISVGPPIIPVFPDFLFFWVKKEDISLNIDMFFNINKPYTVNLEAIRFVNNNKNLQPFKIEHITKNDNKTISIDYNLTDNDSIFKSEEPAYFRFYFKKKIKKVKELEIYIDSLIIDDKTIVLPSLRLKQKREYEYNPLILGS